MTNKTQLINFIRDHDGCDAISKNEDTLIVMSLTSFPRGPLYESTLVTEEIPATMQAVRDWLGY